MNYVKVVIRGFGWTGGFRILSRGIAFARTALVARILSPTQFGVYGVALMVLAFLELLTETGINVFLIQEKESTDTYLDTAWALSILRGLVIAVLILASSPLIAIFFGDDKLNNLLYLASLVPLIRGFINPSMVKLQKELRFKEEFWIRSGIFFLDSLVAIVFAFFLKDPSGLVFGLIAGAIVEVLLSFLVTKPLPRLKLEKVKVLNIINNGRWVTIAGIFDYLAKNGDNLVVGRVLGVSALGYYQMAYTVATLPVAFSDDAGKVTFPIYSKIALDKALLKKTYLKLLLLFTIILIPIPFILFFFTESVVNILLGENWMPAVGALRILSIFGAIRFISATSSSLFFGVKEQKLVTKITFVRMITLGLFVMPYTILFGIEGTAMAALLSSVVPLPIIIYNLAKVLK